MISEFIKAMIFAGIPVAIVSLFFTYVVQTYAEKSTPARLIHQKWMRFGGGFYGVMAVITYVHAEIMDIIKHIARLGDLPDLLASISLDFLIRILIDSVMNFVTAITWFLYWPKEMTMRPMWVWIVACYVAYSFAIKHADRLPFMQQYIEKSSEQKPDA